MSFLKSLTRLISRAGFVCFSQAWIRQVNLPEKDTDLVALFDAEERGLERAAQAIIIGKADGRIRWEGGPTMPSGILVFGLCAVIFVIWWRLMRK